MISLQTDAGAIDLLGEITGIGIYQQVAAAANMVEIDGQHVLVLDLPGLPISKQAVGRPKDLQLLPQLEATLRLRALRVAQGPAEQAVPEARAQSGSNMEQ